MHQQTTRRQFHNAVIATATTLALGATAAPALAASAEELRVESAHALKTLYANHPEAARLAKAAHAILVFPKIIKAGLVFGGSYGEGVMTRGDTFEGYYNSVSASWGWQAGAESYGYVVFLMNDKAVKYLEKSKGWEVGVGPSVVVVNEGVAKNISSATIKDDAYAYIFDQHGLMASLSIEGTKITRIDKTK